MLFGVPRYLWRQVAANIMAMAGAAIRGDEARRFASALRVLWFAGYLRDSWFGSPPAASVPLVTAVGR
jgi:hypothetical protein